MLSRLFGKSQAPNESAESNPPASNWAAGLKATSSRLGRGLRQLLGRGANLDTATREELEDLLLSADVGVDTTQRLLERLQERLAGLPASGSDSLALFREILVQALAPPQVAPSNHEHPHVIMVVGVNGVGKTTSIGKLAWRFKKEGRDVLLAAGDTFRAAASEQLAVWAERAGVQLVSQHQGADAASVIFDALQSARSQKADILIADTAGRLQNKSHLMEELAKVIRVMRKLAPEAPHEVLLVVDASTGQNALNQAREFSRIVPLTGLIVTKLDGTARGGIVFALAEQMQVPVQYVGLGEGLEDLTPFDATSFVDALLGTEQAS